MVAEARAVRERMLGDLARRRDAARSQLERLRADRDRLVPSFEDAGRAVDEVLGELRDVVPAPEPLDVETVERSGRRRGRPAPTPGPAGGARAGRGADDDETMVDVAEDEPSRAGGRRAGARGRRGRPTRSTPSRGRRRRAGGVPPRRGAGRSRSRRSRTAGELDGASRGAAPTSTTCSPASAPPDRPRWRPMSSGAEPADEVEPADAVEPPTSRSRRRLPRRAGRRHSTRCRHRWPATSSGPSPTSRTRCSTRCAALAAPDDIDALVGSADEHAARYRRALTPDLRTATAGRRPLDGLGR